MTKKSKKKENKERTKKNDKMKKKPITEPKPLDYTMKCLQNPSQPFQMHFKTQNGTWSQSKFL